MFIKIIYVNINIYNLFFIINIFKNLLNLHQIKLPDKAGRKIK